MRRHDNAVNANAKSILSVLNIAAAYGTDLQIMVDGEDEIAAMDAIEELFVTGFGEI